MIVIAGVAGGKRVWRVKQFYIGPRMLMFSLEKQLELGIYPLPIVRIIKKNTLIFDGPMLLPEKQF